MEQECQPSIKPQSLKFKVILIISYGRSGSTLLQGILNSIDGVLIKGENANILYHFYSAYRQLILNQDQDPHAQLPIHPWFGACWLDKDQYLRDVNQLATNLLLNHATQDRSSIQAFGFKEIRYATLDDPSDYLEFLEQVFPESCFIHLTRAYNEVAQSQLRKFKKQQFEPSEIQSRLQDFDETIHAFGSLRANYFQIDYSDVISKDFTALGNLYSFLGAAFNPLTIEQVLQAKHSY